MRALLGYQVPSLFRARCTDYCHTRGASELYGRNPYATTRAMHEDHLARTGLRPLEEPAIGGRIRHVNCRALSEGGWLGQRMNLRLSAQRLFGIRPTD